MAKIDPSRNIPTGASEAQDWMQWYKDLKKTFGKKKANSIWAFAWAKRGGVDSQANTRTLSNFMEKQGVDIQRSTFAEFTEGIGDFGSGILSAGKWFLLIGLGIGGIIVLRAVYGAVNNPKKSARTVASLTPAGRGAKALKGLK